MITLQSEFWEAYLWDDSTLTQKTTFILDVFLKFETTSHNLIKIHTLVWLTEAGGGGSVIWGGCLFNMHYQGARFILDP